MSQAMTIERDVHFRRYGRGSPRHLEPGERPQPLARVAGRIPRIARLMALAIRFEEQVRQGVLASYAELAALGHVSRARVSQIMNLVNLAPDRGKEVWGSRPWNRVARRLQGGDWGHLAPCGSRPQVWSHYTQLGILLVTGTGGGTGAVRRRTSQGARRVRAGVGAARRDARGGPWPSFSLSRKRLVFSRMRRSRP
jgi:hypothetical protein